MSKYRPSQHPTWYCRRGDVVLGPVSTKVLHHYLFDGTLADGDAGRVGLDGEWVPVIDLRRMFEEDGFVRPATSENTRQAATKVIDRSAHTRPRLTPSRSSPGWLRRQIDFITEVADRIAGWIADVIVGVAALLMRSLRLRSVQLLFGGIAIATIVWGVVLPNWPLVVEDELGAYRSLLDEMNHLIGTDSNHEKWNSLQMRLTQQIDKTGPRVRASATSLRPDFQNLMWAIDLFPKALAQARSGQVPEASVLAMVDRHLEQADRFIQRQATLARRKSPTEPRDTKRIAAAILTPLIAGVALIWRRRVCRSKAGEI